MERMIDDLHEFSRVQSEAKMPAPVSFEHCLAGALENLTSEITQRNAQVSYDSLPTLKADETQILRLFQNLVDNAMKYCDDQPKIHVSAEQVDNEWVFRIEDNGIGVDPKFAERIFKIFVRVQPTDDEGTGLGLAICQKIVERHGGRIWVEAVPDRRGSIFCFTMPADENG
jgi:signal transduction histidine kinase